MRHIIRYERNTTPCLQQYVPSKFIDRPSERLAYVLVCFRSDRLSNSSILEASIWIIVIVAVNGPIASIAYNCDANRRHTFNREYAHKQADRVTTRACVSAVFVVRTMPRYLYAHSAHIYFNVYFSQNTVDARHFVAVVEVCVAIIYSNIPCEHVAFYINRKYIENEPNGRIGLVAVARLPPNSNSQEPTVPAHTPFESECKTSVTYQRRSERVREREGTRVYWCGPSER